MPRSLIILILLLMLTALLVSAGTPGQMDDEYLPQEFSSSEIIEGYSNSPESGLETVTTLPVELPRGTDSAYFTLSWADDEPESEPDVFRLTVTGEVGGIVQSKTESGYSPLAIAIAGDLGASWEVEIELLEAGTVPGGLLGLVPALNTPDPGNGWTLDIEYSGVASHSVAFPSPDFVLTDVDGRPFRLSDHFGSVIIIDLTMRCPPCTDQIKQLIPVDKNHGDGVVIISIDTTGASNDVVRNYKQSTGGTWAFARDTDAVVQKYQMTTMRKLVMLDINGNVFYTSPDVVSTSELEQQIATGLSGQAQGIDLGSMGLLGLAFFAGISAFFAPCALPLLPGYMLNISGNKEPSKKAALSRVSFAVSIGLGAAVFYIFLGGVIAGMGALAADVLPAFGAAAALLLIFVGVAFLMGKHLSWSVAAYRLKKALGLSTQNEFGARPAKVLSLIVEEENREVFLYGVGYGAASSACHGVLMVSVMLAASSGGWLAGFQAVMLWSLGMLAMMAAAFFLAFFVMENAIEKLAAKTAILNRFSGLLLLVAGIWMVYYLL